MQLQRQGQKTFTPQLLATVAPDCCEGRPSTFPGEYGDACRQDCPDMTKCNMPQFSKFYSLYVQLLLGCWIVATDFAHV